MSDINDKLLESLRAGFINQTLPAYNDYLPQLLVNDKYEGKKILSSILHGLNHCEEFWFSVAFVTTSGIAALMQTLIELEKKKVKGKILVSQYLNFTQPEALKRLIRFTNIEVKIAVEGEFHSKGFLFKRGEVYDLIIGSSNLTANALCSNIEWNLKVTATPVSHIIFNAIKEFTSECEKAILVDETFIEDYNKLYKQQLSLNSRITDELVSVQKDIIKPNSMQVEALSNIELLRYQKKSKALLISATGTGKTFLSAFDVKKYNPKKFLFVVHRENIARAAMKAYKKIFGNAVSMGMYTGNQKDLDADYLFATIQTLSNEEHLKKFSQRYFDYIVIDETHRAGAESYQKVFEYFEPKFLLGMTATPERTDGVDIFKLFDYNIAYEIRLHRALEENILSPFHYYGVTDLTVNGRLLEDDADFNLLTSEERLNRIVENAKLYGTDTGRTRGLIFCSRVEEANKLSEGFNLRGFKTKCLSGNDSEEVRAKAIEDLESEEHKLDYIFSVDIFNEGIDIPSVNQVIMLRPTQSAIIFVQQLGRGLRKVDNKEYLTVIDFIGNYKNNFLVPIALYGDTTYNKDTLRKLMASGSNLIPGTSTINFDRISKEKIFAAIDAANMQTRKELVNDYKLLKFKLGRIPMMVDFLDHGSRDPFLYVTKDKSYYNFVSSVEDTFDVLRKNETKILELLSLEINNSKRVEESLLLDFLINKGTITKSQFKKYVLDKFGYSPTDETIESVIHNLNFHFITEKKNGELKSVNEIYGYKIVLNLKGTITLDSSFVNLLKSVTFKDFVIDSAQYSIRTFERQFKLSNFINGFVLYRKYSRKDTFRILNWKQNPVAQNVGGYMVSSDQSNCPIFITLHKEENISSSIKYDDGIVDNHTIKWESKSPRRLDSPEIKLMRDKTDFVRLPLFIQKNNDEGIEFYYMGEVKPLSNGFKQSTMMNDAGRELPVVKVQFEINPPIGQSIYEYLTTKQLDDFENEPTSSSNIIPLYPFKILEEKEIDPFKNCIPLYDLKAAAGEFSELQIDPSTEWIAFEESFKYSDDYFVCKVLGESMNKVIPNNSWCLFKKDSGGTRNGKIVLAYKSDFKDSDFGGQYTVKKYTSNKTSTEEGWQHESIILKPESVDKSYKDLVLSNDELTDFIVVGIFVKVLGSI